jgi:hypothetical protein
LAAVRQTTKDCNRHLRLSSSRLVVLVGLDTGSFYHEKFVRGHPELARDIRRQAVKGILGPNRGSHPVTSTPNLYELPFLPVNDASSATTASLLSTPVHLVSLVNSHRDTIVSSSTGCTLGAEIAEFQASRHRAALLQCLLEQQQQQQQLQALMASTFDLGQYDGLQRELSASPLVGLLLENQRNEMIRRRALALALLRNFH